MVALLIYENRNRPVMVALLIYENRNRPVMVASLIYENRNRSVVVDLLIYENRKQRRIDGSRLLEAVISLERPSFRLSRNRAAGCAHHMSRSLAATSTRTALLAAGSSRPRMLRPRLTRWNRDRMDSGRKRLSGV
jgi:hypothetical protein